MAAAPFTQTLLFVGARSKKPMYIRQTVSDVSAASTVNPDASTTLQLPGDEDWFLADMVIVTGGTDTTNQTLYVNQQNTGIVIDNKSNLNTVQNRLFALHPLGFKAGSQLKLIQAA
jgi:hypothetical protein